MWLSKKLRENQRQDEAAADLGVTTIGGGKAGVYTRGEVRDLSVCTPGGICWQPCNGDKVVVLKGGPGGEEACILGVQNEENEEEVSIADGELYLHSASASICLRNDGTIELTGQLFINGDPYRPCVCFMGGTEGI